MWHWVTLLSVYIAFNSISAADIPTAQSTSANMCAIDISTHDAYAPEETCKIVPPPPVFSWITQIFTSYMQRYTWTEEECSHHLYSAIKHGDATRVEQWLEYGVDPNYQRYGSLYRPLHAAAYYNHPAIISLLIQYGAHVNKFGVGQLTPVHIAANNGNIACIERLYHHGAYIDITDITKSTPLLIAINNQQEGAAHQLLIYGARPDIINAAGESVLHKAVSCSPSLVKTLVANGALVDMRSEIHHDTPLHRLPYSHHSKNIPTLWRASANPNAKDKNGITPLEHTIEIILPIDHKMEIASWFIACGATLPQYLQEKPYEHEIHAATQGYAPEGAYVSRSQALRIMIGYNHHDTIVRHFTKISAEEPALLAEVISDMTELNKASLLRTCTRDDMLTPHQLRQVCNHVEDDTLHQLCHIRPVRIHQEYYPCSSTTKQRILEQTQLMSILTQVHLHTRQRRRQLTDIDIICHNS